MSSSEGRYEIEAAKARLAAAKAQRTSSEKLMSCANEVTKNAEFALYRAQRGMTAAKKNEEMIQSQLDKAREEVKAAEKCLAESEKRHEVIDIDDIDDTPQKKDDSNKKRKVSMSPREQGNNSNNNDEVVILSNSPPRRSTGNNSNGGGSTLSREQLQSTTLLERRLEEIRRAERQHITVQGCGTSAVNGLYTKTGTLCEGSPTYSKTGIYNGNSEVIVIFCRKGAASSNKYWYIGISGKPVFFYKSSRAVGAGPHAGSAVCPPSLANEWVKKDVYKGRLPLPRVRLGVWGLGGS